MPLFYFVSLAAQRSLCGPEVEDIVKFDSEWIKDGFPSFRNTGIGLDLNEEEMKKYAEKRCAFLCKERFFYSSPAVEAGRNIYLTQL